TRTRGSRAPGPPRRSATSSPAQVSERRPLWRLVLAIVDVLVEPAIVVPALRPILRRVLRVGLHCEAREGNQQGHSKKRNRTLPNHCLHLLPRNHPHPCDGPFGSPVARTHASARTRRLDVTGRQLPAPSGNDPARREQAAARPVARSCGNATRPPPFPGRARPMRGTPVVREESRRH